MQEPCDSHCEVKSPISSSSDVDSKHLKCRQKVDRNAALNTRVRELINYNAGINPYAEGGVLPPFDQISRGSQHYFAPLNVQLMEKDRIILARDRAIIEKNNIITELYHAIVELLKL